jgi:hypothetical protein
VCSLDERQSCNQFKTHLPYRLSVDDSTVGIVGRAAPPSKPQPSKGKPTGFTCMLFSLTPRNSSNIRMPRRSFNSIRLHLLHYQAGCADRQKRAFLTLFNMLPRDRDQVDVVFSFSLFSHHLYITSCVGVTWFGFRVLQLLLISTLPTPIGVGQQ